MADVVRALRSQEATVVPRSRVKGISKAVLAAAAAAAAGDGDGSEVDSLLTPQDKAISKNRRIDTVRTAAFKQRVRMHDVDHGAKCLRCEDNCPGFEFHFWRKLCRHCHCPREDHDVWTDGASGTRPVMRATAEARALAKQDPQHDHNVEACAHVKTEEQRETFQLLADERRHSLDIARHLDEMEQAGIGLSTCATCQLPVDPQDQLRADLLQSDFHSGCFKCFECKEELAENTYYAYHRRPYCGRCHAEKFYPRCAGCDELILDQTYTRADGQTWHKGHLCCIDCDTSLSGQSFSHTVRGHLVCLGCYEVNHAPLCTTCGITIRAGEEAVQAGDQHLHKSAACFRCFLCEESLIGQPCVAMDGSVYCVADYEKLTQQICATCCKPIVGSFVEAAANKYHADCFVCAECNLPLGSAHGMAAYPVPDGIMCYDHALSSRMASCVLQPVGQVARPKAVKSTLKEELL